MYRIPSAIGYGIWPNLMLPSVLEKSVFEVCENDRCKTQRGISFTRDIGANLKFGKHYLEGPHTFIVKEVGS